MVQQDAHQDGTENANERKVDGLHKTSSRPVGGASDSSAVEPVVAKPSSTNSKKGSEVGVVIFDFCFLFLLFLLERILTNCSTNYHQNADLLHEYILFSLIIIK